MTTYFDFDLLFYTGADGVPQVRADGTEGQAHAPLRLPPAVTENHDVLSWLAVQARARAGRDLTPADALPDATELGMLLHEALFAGPIGTCFAACRGAKAPGTVLRIRLQYDLNDDGARALASLPWELMRERNTDTAVVLSRDLALVRHVDVTQSTRTPAFSPPLRILLAMSNPLDDLDLEAERAKIETRLRAHAHEIRAEFRGVNSLSELEEHLHAGGYHVVHFMGHGDFADGAGSLLIGDRLYGANHLAPIIARSRQTRLVVLNACRTAEIARDHGQDPFAGLAVALVRKGVPAVVAMQLPIPDEAASLFAERFYTEVARRSPLEEAVDTARLRLWTEYDDMAITATPVLFLRSAGDLFATQVTDTSSADVPTLATFMLDRLEVIERLAAALRTQEQDDGAPLVAIAHGADEACFDTLVDRLQRRELPRYLVVDERRQSIRRYRFDWPPPYGTARELHQFLTFSIARKVTDRGAATLDEVRGHFGALSAPPLVFGTLSAATWQANGGRRCLDDFIAYWSDWPRAAGRQRVIVLLGITYAPPVPARRGLLTWLSRRARPVNDEISDVLEEIGGRVADGVRVVVLPRLGGITYDHAHSWALEVGRPDLIPEIRRIFRDHGRDAGNPAMSMEQASASLQRLLADEPINRGAA